MVISLHGERFIDSERFIAYCRSIKVDQNFSSGDLELYEKEGLLLPVAKIVQPSEYLVLRQAQFNTGGDSGASIEGWEELEKLLYGNSYDGLWHKFDREFDRQNKYLIDPSKTGYRLWDMNAKHYYHYWQIYQVYELQSRFPIFSKYHSVYDALKNDSRLVDNFHPGIPNHVVDLYRNYSRFDALSFFIVLYAGERVRTFLLPTGGIRRLDSGELENYKTRLKKHADFTLDRFQLKENTEWMYEFLMYLLKLQSSFEQEEKILLAKEIEKDFVNLVRFVFYVKGQGFEEIQETLGSRTDVFTKEQFRHLDRSLLVKDDVEKIFKYSIKSYNDLFPNFCLSSTDLEQLLNFFDTHSLFIIPYAIRDIQETFDHKKDFPRISLFASLSNLSVGFETFLRAIGGSGKVLYDVIDNQ